MQTRSRIFDDAAKLAGGAVGTIESIRREVEALVKQQVERVMSRFDLVTRDEFEAVKEMATQARIQQEELAAKLSELEASQTKTSRPKKAVRRKRPKAKKA
ncbi:MAG: pyrroline-5-carboxylate reductase [Rhodospirillaceae bacterium]|nr:pyrroline-5-carboxylate reductase [Rhodospirillaceae bacterium]|tara:strand:+ start:6710 stop:7012 length:303 start_codon:yes stop_codon:yes gene_type:complete